uniref:Uncharacterized protein n=1 Tax=Candidatus Kentrum sp. TUN TaxID=2126343 RepID=A0A451A884_9GAMM|nr:MAG: hypothetical protein BECKTUN1418D_GA0071000_11706 [Candidatus Kentron sp. TUN]
MKKKLQFFPFLPAPVGMNEGGRNGFAGIIGPLAAFGFADCIQQMGALVGIDAGGESLGRGHASERGSNNRKSHLGAGFFVGPQDTLSILAPLVHRSVIGENKSAIGANTSANFLANSEFSFSI